MGLRHDAVGTHALGKLEDGRRVRAVLTEPHIGLGGRPQSAGAR
jgi:hypothetical protein